MLTESDAKVLEAIAAGEQDPKAIADKLGMKVEAVRASADSLGEQGLIEVKKTVSEIFSLTGEGEAYSRQGLPERQLLERLGQGVPLSELRDPTLKIGIGWIKKKGWAVIEGGVMRPSGHVSAGEDEAVLQALHGGPRDASGLSASALAALKGRGLVTSSEQKSWLYRPTEKARAELAARSGTAGEAAVTIKQLTPELLKSGMWRDRRFTPYDVTLSAERLFPGKIHPYQRLLEKMRLIMLEMGFAEIRGDIVQSSFWNFDALFQPQDHPAREMQDTFYLSTKADLPDCSGVKEMHERGGNTGSTGWGGCWSEEVARQEVLRTHTTAVTIKYLADHPEPPVKAFCIDRVYRRESIDATHTPEFEQLEGVIMDRGVTFANLLGLLKEFYSKMGFHQVRFRPGYFPYTEPSVEPEVWIDGLGWVELGGAGVFRREVTAPFGIDHPVLAWGLGVSRLAMLTLGLKDLRLLYQSDLEWLRDTPISVYGGH
ncbi:MAG: Phenylalanine--tRNA ligase alpha subunit [Methanosaeta sp. PtaB.Bin039]|nr:MAG: Phenylalanine--tRNA ligase alpha subunit [Methanosaeta sp. PtaB.Bin039]OPY44379.1 MAG: Phenylalanine--tRNA ligase alpha subunit [Methanosaeta sp. PtaU1.Bin028]HOT06243.1 phenylalanine--tRNA ligase subunit alpha [Methanotrichaceae archaeon]HQF15447.1 phenylalanine--tRNA ligase subunit alpha [Methanotrichaceae archaeon]HQI90182.1 phenylalanine--tRNA ligase subunit alpha [Methanotrichaceae archaeon]